MRPLGWTLIQYERCPSEKKRVGHTERQQGYGCTEEESREVVGGGRPQREPIWHFGLGLPASRAGRK